MEAPQGKIGRDGLVPLGCGATSPAIGSLPTSIDHRARRSQCNRAELELVNAHEQHEGLKHAAALAAAEADHVPRIPPCACCAALLSSTANYCGTCGYPVSAAGGTPRTTTDRPTTSHGCISAGINSPSTQQPQQPTSSATHEKAWTGGGDAPGPASVVASLKDALGGSSSAASLPSPGCQGDLPGLPRRRGLYTHGRTSRGSREHSGSQILRCS